MYLATLRIENFRKIECLELEFQPNLNILIGANNVGKTAVIDSIRALIGAHGEQYLKIDSTDLHTPSDAGTPKQISFQYTFRGLDIDDEADFLPALKPYENGGFEAQITVAFSTIDDTTDRLRTRRWCGDHEEVAVTSDMLENLRSIYLPPLRDASRKLRPSRSSQVSKLFHLLSNDRDRIDIEEKLVELDSELRRQPPLVNIEKAIQSQHEDMLGSGLSQQLKIGLSGSDFKKLSSRLSILADSFEIEQNGLGFNNLIYMAVVLGELSKDPLSNYRALVIEEPEAHLHPQLQAVLLSYLQEVRSEEHEKPVQLFLTSHSPNFASIADLDSLICLVDTTTGIDAYCPRSANFAKGKKEKLARYLDVTRAELFFARRIIFVEGAAELMLVNVLAQKSGYNLRQNGVSLISVDGLNFDSFLPLFGDTGLKIPVAVITDADPPKKLDGSGELQSIYPELDDEVDVSDNTRLMKEKEDDYIRVFHGETVIQTV